ncbi:RNA polymerase sigma factor [Polaribacter sp. IC073]|uniref:RNA polymerase sigma factor n=1 Tax=Polaribacter sp. IC073 TaxID=2508540 RepID=UPI0011BE59FA|nr:sigma-70 family RNA polymerase sigma factor [Polaribacter sp. IC073]TXD49429.1 sigma-70 family RNA polymerase sigma factor [Polaribacter sp. IC073]
MTKLDKLVLDFQNKNIAAFEKLYNMYYKSIHGVIYNLIRDTEIANELTQDVFLKAWNNSGKYSSKKGRIFTWLLCMARNTAIDKLRSKDYKNSKKNIISEELLKNIECDENFNVLTNTIGLKKLVSTLEISHKKIINLIYFKGYTHKETSEALNIPLGTVKTRNRNSLKILKLLF